MWEMSHGKWFSFLPFKREREKWVKLLLIFADRSSFIWDGKKKRYIVQMTLLWTFIWIFNKRKCRWCCLDIVYNVKCANLSKQLRTQVKCEPLTMKGTIFLENQLPPCSYAVPKAMVHKSDAWGQFWGLPRARTYDILGDTEIACLLEYQSQPLSSFNGAGCPGFRRLDWNSHLTEKAKLLIM